MKNQHELVLYEDVTPHTYLTRLLAIYPYDIDHEIVYSLLSKHPSTSGALLSFIDYARSIQTYRILKTNQEQDQLSSLFVHMCEVSQRNQTVLHTHQFQLDATLYIKDVKFHNPYAHLPLQNIPFIDHIHLQEPLSITMDTIDEDAPIHLSNQFIYRDISLQATDFIALSIQITDMSGIVFLPRHQIGLLLACASLFQITPPSHNSDFFLIYGLIAKETSSEIYMDQTNNLYIGLMKGVQTLHHINPLKDMIMTLYNSLCLKKHDYPLHAAMIQLHFPQRTLGLVLVGEANTGKSNLMDRLFHICKQKQIPFTKVFDDQGTLHYMDDELYATGSQIGACVHINDLPKCSIFEHLSASIQIQRKQQTTHLIIPYTSFQETLTFHKVDALYYLNNLEQKKGLQIIDDLQVAITMFHQGLYRKKGCRKPQSSPFVNPYGCVQQESISYALLCEFLNLLFIRNVEIACLHTRVMMRQSQASSTALAMLIFTHLQAQVL